MLEINERPPKLTGCDLLNVKREESGLDVGDAMVDPEADRINWYFRFQRLKEENVSQNVGIIKEVV